MTLVITRETDYGLRILRALRDGEKHTVGELAEGEMIPKQFAYKIIKKLAKAGFVRMTRGAAGGCSLAGDLSEISLYDVILAVDGSSDLGDCMDPDYHCPWRETHGGCAIHCRLAEVQQQLNDTLKSRSLREILAE